MRYFILFFLLSCTVFSQENNITNAEYYWGQTDPGFGQGIALNAADGAFNASIEEIIANYTVTQTENGPILFNIRVKDAEDNWGPTFKKVIFIGGVTDTPQQITITGFEYYFGNFDPGEGNGTTIVAFDGALDSAVEEVFRDQTTWDNTTGPVLFNIRAKDGDGLWGPVFKKTIFPYGANPNAQLIAEGDSIEICPGSEVTLTYNGPFGYTPTWFDGSNGNTITFTPEEEGNISCSASLNGNTYTDSIEIKFKELPSTDISITGSVLVCSSSNFNLETEENSNYSYQWYLNDSEITNATNSTYLPTAIGSYTLEITDNNTSCSKTSDPTILTSNFLMTPNAAQSFCNQQILTVPFGSTNTYQWKRNDTNIDGATSHTFTAISSGSYTCVINNGNCSFTTSATILNPITEEPSAEVDQSFNAGDKLEDLNVTGVNLLWYESLTETATLSASTELVDGETYYVSQTINNCESERIGISVSLFDTTIPVITLLGDATVTIEVGDTYTDAGATALDNYDGDITNDIVVVNPVDTDLVGSYTVTYNVADDNDNDAVQVTRTVNVIDTTVPVITLLGEATVDIEVGSTYTDAGATASDNYDGDLTASIVTVNNVDTSSVGSYTVTYNVADENDNDAVEVTRTVNVESTLSIDKNTKIILSIFPNPAKSIVNISVSNEHKIKDLKLYDLLGKSYLFKTDSETFLDMGNLSKGVYILELIFENGKKMTQKIIKN